MESKENVIVLSIAIITYNQVDYVKKTMDSILQQNIEVPFEIIIGDDFSTDGTRKILLDYKDKFPDIITLLFNGKNLGLIPNYFNVIEHCNGEFIMQCAGDDYWTENKVEMQLDFMKSNPFCGITFAAVSVFDQSANRFVSDVWVPEKPRFDDLVKQNRIAAVTLCFRKKLFESYRQEVDPVNRGWIIEDYPFLLYATINSTLLGKNSVMAVYRELNSSLSHFTDFSKAQKFFETICSINEFYISKGSRSKKINFKDTMHRSISMQAVKFGIRDSVISNINSIQKKNIRDSTLKLLSKSNLSFLFLKILLNLARNIYKKYFRIKKL